MKKCPGHIWLWEEDEYIALREALNKHDPPVSIAKMAIFLENVVAKKRNGRSRSRL